VKSQARGVPQEEVVELARSTVVTTDLPMKVLGKKISGLTEEMTKLLRLLPRDLM